MQRHLIYCGLYANGLYPDQADQLARDLAMAHFPNGHTIYEAEGRWAGINVECNEPTLIIEVWEVAGFDTPDVIGLAADYKELASQESVVILKIPCEATVI